MTRPTLRHALAGLQAGVPGAIVMVLWVIAVSLFNRHSIWRVPNLFGTTFYGPEAYRGGFSMASASGLALILVIYGCLGAIWGIGFGEQRRAFLLVIGALTGLAVYFVFFRLIWNHFNPALALYAPTRALQVGHILWGMMLARSPKYAARLAPQLATPWST